MSDIGDVFLRKAERRATQDGVFSPEEVGLANRNHGALLEMLKLDITPTGAHYLLTHFDVPLIDAETHALRFHGAFSNPYSLDMAEIRSLPRVTMPVTLECAGNGRTQMSPRSFSMPWSYEAVGTSEWTGTPLRPLIERAGILPDAVEVSFTAADFGFDKGHAHAFGRSLTLQQLADLDVLLVYEMNGQPLLPQHGAPLRLIVPGWYGMASVKWLTDVGALTSPYQGFQQVGTYRFRQTPDEAGDPVTTIRVKSLMVPPGVPDWVSRKRYLTPGPVELVGRAWSGAGVPVVRIEVSVDDAWFEAELGAQVGPYAWRSWRFDWQATSGAHVLRCRATDADGAVQPLDPVWDLAGFANNVVQRVEVFVDAGA